MSFPSIFGVDYGDGYNCSSPLNACLACYGTAFTFTLSFVLRFLGLVRVVFQGYVSWLKIEVRWWNECNQSVNFRKITLSVTGHIVCRICMRQFVPRPQIISLLFRPQMMVRRKYSWTPRHSDKLFSERFAFSFHLSSHQFSIFISWQAVDKQIGHFRGHTWTDIVL
jgi:hypothetical protein